MVSVTNEHQRLVVLEINTLKPYRHNKIFLYYQGTDNSR